MTHPVPPPPGWPPAPGRVPRKNLRASMVCAAIGAPLYLVGGVAAGATGGGFGTSLVASAVCIAGVGIGLGRLDLTHTPAGSPQRRRVVYAMGSCVAIMIAGLIVTTVAAIAYLLA